MLKLKHIKKKEKVNKMKTETLETISEEFEQNKEIEQGKPMFTINKDLEVVETANIFSNPLSQDYNALTMFLKNHSETLKEYHDSNENYGIAFYECGYNGTEQNIFIQDWMDVNVRVF